MNRIPVTHSRSVTEEDSSRQWKNKPDFVSGFIVTYEFDGITNDLLTGGLGRTGLESGAPVPQFADPEHPTAMEIRTAAIYHNYKALKDCTPGSGYGTLYGPNVAPDGTPGKGQGLIAGREYLAFSDDGTGRNVTMMVQIPDTFDSDNPCIVAAASSGSRGIYGAIGTAGEWGLKRGFAVCYTDKGTGNGVHDLDAHTVNLITGERANAAAAGGRSNFTVSGDGHILDKFRKAYPNRIAVKHTHSGRNPEKDWGMDLLHSIEFAFYILNLPENRDRKTTDEKPVRTLTPDNTIVMASGVSNGGGTALKAVEQDTRGLIHGVAISEPNITPAPTESLAIRQGKNVWRYPNHSRPIDDYYTLLHLLQPCANLTPENTEAPGNTNIGETSRHRCARLARLGLISGDTIEEQAGDAQRILNACGILTEQNILTPSHDAFSLTESIAYTYTSAHGRFSVTDNFGGYSVAATDENGKPAPMTAAQSEELFSIINGIPPALHLKLINNNSKNGPMTSRASTNPDSTRDQNLDGALYLRRVVTGAGTAGEPLSDEEQAIHNRIAHGMSEIRATGKLHGTPVICVTGRSDAVIAPNHASRPYFGVNQMKEGNASRFRYIEVLNAHHLDVYNETIDGFQERFIPLLPYFNQAMDLIYDYLKNGKDLPPSQVVRTVPRGRTNDGHIPSVTPANMPPISEHPDEIDRIRFIEGTTVVIPD